MIRSFVFGKKVILRQPGRIRHKRTSWGLLVVSSRLWIGLGQAYGAETVGDAFVETQDCLLGSKRREHRLQGMYVLVQLNVRKPSEIPDMPDPIRPGLRQAGHLPKFFRKGPDDLDRRGLLLSLCDLS